MADAALPVFGGNQKASSSTVQATLFLRDSSGDGTIARYGTIQRLTRTGGELVTAIVTKTAAYVATNDDDVILCDATSAAFTVTLPPVASSSGLTLTIKKIDSGGNAITIDGDGSEVIDGATTKSLSAQWAAITITNNGTAWYIIGELD